jgi:hypothetical protein
MMCTQPANAKPQQHKQNTLHHKVVLTPVATTTCWHTACCCHWAAATHIAPQQGEGSGTAWVTTGHYKAAKLIRP